MNDFEMSDKHRAKMLEQQKRLRERDESDLRKVLSIVEGRRVVWRILSECGLYRSPFSTDAALMSFNMGRHDIALMLYAAIMKAKPEAYEQMRRDHAADQLYRPIPAEQKEEE